MKHRRLGMPALKPSSYGAIERKALQAREWAGVAIDDAFPCRETFEKLDEFEIRGVCLEPHVFEPSDEDEGFTVYIPEENVLEMNLNEKVYRDLQAEDGRARFTFCHELGHLHLHLKELKALRHLSDRGRMLFRESEKTHKVSQDVEWQADVFAGALLAPARALDALEQDGKILNPLLMRTLFGMSFAAASRRLEIYRERKQELLR